MILVLRPAAADGESHTFVGDQGKDHVEALDTVSGPGHEQLGVGVVVSGGFDGAVGDQVRVQILAGFEVGVDRLGVGEVLGGVGDGLPVRLEGACDLPRGTGHAHGEHEQCGQVDAEPAKTEER